MVGGAFRLTLHEVEEPADLRTFDLAELQPVDHTEDVGEGRPVCEAATWEEVAGEAERLGAADHRWLNQGMVADEYSDDVTQREAHHDAGD